MIDRKEILKWAESRELLKSENAKAQTIKLMEEVGELSGAILKNKPTEQIDAIGDIQVVLIILAKQLGIDYDAALESAYDTIKGRTGKTVGGSFIKD
jgi:NTP pyrophosphatase (non-canonical NTP hydrolase)